MVHRVSIVIIGKNEERTIGLCAEAALAAAEEIGGAEMIYVDSHSTDGTVALMASLGFKTAPLDPGMRATPSAGRYVGSRLAKGDLVLFLDADTLIYRDFLGSALKKFDEDPELGGCNGRIDDHTEAGIPVFGVEDVRDQETDVDWLRGPCCLYRRKALIQSGSFDPDLATEEEAELGLRITGNGWKLRWIPIPMARHTRCYHGDSLSSVLATFVRDHRSKRLGEITRTISHAFLAGNGLAFLWLRLKTTILFVSWILLIIAVMVLPSPIAPLWSALGLAVTGLAMIGLKKGSLTQALIFVPSKILNILDVLMGLHKIDTKLPAARTRTPATES